MANGTSPSSIKAGQAHVEITGTTKPLDSALDRAKSKLLAVGKIMAVAGGGLMAGGTATLGALTGTFLKFTNHANEISRLATKLGTSTEQLSEFAYAAETTGMSFEDLTGQFENLAERVAQGAVGSGEAADTFKRLGIDAAQLKLQNPIDQMLTLAEAMQGVTNETDRLGMLSTLGGDQFQWMNNIFKKGPEGIRALMGEAKKVGASVSSEEAAEAARASAAIDRAWAAVKNSIMRVGAALLPSLDTIERFSAAIIDGAAQFREFLQENRALVMYVGAAGAALVAVGGALVGVGAFVSALAPAFSVISTAISALVGGVTFLIGAVPVVFGAIAAIPGIIAGIPAALVAIPGLLLGAGVFLVKALAVAAAIAGVGYGLHYLATQTEFGESILDGVVEAGGEVFAYLRDIAMQVKDAVLTIIAPLVDTWDDIRASFAAGDIAGAFKLTIAALKVSWAEFMIYFQEGWNRVERWFSETWLEIQFQFEMAWIKIKALVSGLADLFAPQIATMKALWKGFLEVAISVGTVVGAILYLAVVAPIEKFIGLAVRAMQAVGNSSMAKSLEASLVGTLNDTEKLIDELARGVELDTQRQRQLLEAEKKVREQIAEEERRVALAKTKEERDAAKGRLDALRAELAAKRAIAAVDANAQAAAGAGGVSDKIMELVRASKANDAYHSTRGSFDARNARQEFGGAVAIAEKQLKAQEGANDKLKEILEKLAEMNLTWG